MPANTRPTILRKVLEDQFSLLASELVSLYEQEVATWEAEQRELVRCEVAENLNQAVRMLRQAEDFQEVSAVLVDTSAAFCRLLAVFSIEGETVRAARIRGVSDAAVEEFCTLEFPLQQAAAFLGAVQAGDPVIAMTTPREVSPSLWETFGHKTDDRAYILPIFVREKPVGLIYAAGLVEMPQLELLAQAAALVLEVRTRPPEPARKQELVMIQGGRPTAIERGVPASWAELTPPDQEIHLRAQRFARVQVAGLKLFSPDIVKRGRGSKNLYAALQKDIDSSREIFRQTFLAATPTMVDYYHLELLRTLANDDASLLGENYPGPLV
jgi:hypothetical protein